MSQDETSNAPEETRQLDPRLTATFLQCLMHQRFVSERNALKIITRIDRAEDPNRPSATIERLDLYVNELMKHVLERLSMKIVRYRDQQTHEFQYHLVNGLGSDNVSKLGTGLSPAELEYFRCMIDYIMSGTGTSTLYDKFYIAETRLMDCNRVTVTEADGTERTTVLLDHQAVDRLVVKLVEDGWLKQGEVAEVQVYTLGNRTLCELEHYLEDKFGDNGDQTLRHCMICQKIFTLGWQCTTTGCPTRVHVHCGEAMAQRHAEGKLECPACRVDIKVEHQEVGI